MSYVLLLLACALTYARCDASVNTSAGYYEECDLSRYEYLFRDGRFTDKREAGAGANGCVVIVKDNENGGVDVALKVSKKPGKLQSWTDECNDMKTLRQAACSSHGASAKAMKLAERYLPTCLEVGGTDDAPYIIMHAAPGQGIGKSYKTLAKQEKGAEVFAQLVGAVTSMHGVGYTHNDLHDNNVVIMDVDAERPALVFIDFGEVVSLSKGKLTGDYKQDETVLAYAAGKLAKCPAEALYGHPKDYDFKQHESQKEKLFTCLTSVWKIDEEFRAAFDTVIDEAFERAVPKKVPALYSTAWVQKQQEELKSFFPTPAGWCDKSTQPYLTIV